MDGVAGEFGTDTAVRAGEDGRVVHIGDAVTEAVGLQAGVQLDHFLEGVGHFRPPAQFVRGEQGADDRSDVVVEGQFHHALDVGEGGVFVVGVAEVHRDVIDSGEKDEGTCADVQHVRPETEQHLRGDFSADAPADEAGPLEEFRPLAGPAVGDGIPVQDDAGALRGFEGGIGFRIAAEMENFLSLGGSGEGKQQGKEEKGFFHGISQCVSPQR